MTDSFKRSVEERYTYDGEEVYWKVDHGKMRAGDLAGHISSSGHVLVSIGGVQLPAERIAFLLHYGRYPNGVLQHINGDPLDNRIENIREPLETS